MIRTFCILILLLPLAVSSQVLSSAQLQQDFGVLRSGLEEAHGGLYRFASPKQMTRYFEKGRKDLKRPMTNWEFYGYVSKFLAGIRDGHLRVDIDPAAQAKIKRPLFLPLDVLVEGSVVTIKTNDSKTDTLIKPGMQLLAVNGHKIAEIRKRILPRLASDGYNLTRKIRRMERSFGVYYWSFVDTASSFLVKAKTPSGEIITARLEGIINAEKVSNRLNNPVNRTVLPLLKRVEQPQENITLHFFNDSIAHLRINLFVGKTFEKEIDSVFRKIKDHNTKGLIVDLRGNMGGLDHLGSYLISKLVTKPFRYLDHIHARTLIPSFASWKEKPPVDLVNGTKPDPRGGYLLKPQLNSCIAEQKPSPAPYTGRLAVLIDGTTFSTAGDVSSLLSHLTQGTFVGEETGGGHQGNTSALDAILKLPNSNLNVRIHLWDFWTAVPQPQKPGRGTFPHHTVVRKSRDWLNGMDAQLSFAAALLQ